MRLAAYNIVIELNGSGGGPISSDLKAPPMGRGPIVSLFNAAMDGIESMILGHACAGVDVQSPAYLEGIETAVEACGNHL